jgi:Raf kinase inhibitor-like YbhB/YbcL family protein
MALSITSRAFKANEAIPSKYTCDGSDVSPDLQWRDAPAGLQSFALICDDPDAPRGTWVHWVLYDLPANVTELSEGLDTDAQVRSPSCKQGVNDFGRTGYGGPCPPRGSSHRYYFRLYALDQMLNLSPKASRADLDRAMKGHILAQAELMGTYQRK